MSKEAILIVVFFLVVIVLLTYIVIVSKLYKLQRSMLNMKEAHIILCGKLSTANKKIAELSEQQRRIDVVFEHMDVSVDVDVNQYGKYSRSWAVISLQGLKTDYVKFVDLSDRDIYAIQKFLRQFDTSMNTKIDATPTASTFLRITKR
jgi:hypothetical protein